MASVDSQTEGTMVMRDTGLHAAIAIAVCMLVGVVVDLPAIGGAAGLLAASLVTWKWPPRPATVSERDQPVP